MKTSAITLNKNEIIAAALITVWFGVVVISLALPKVIQTTIPQTAAIYKTAFVARTATIVTPISSTKPIAASQPIAMVKPLTLVAPRPIIKILPLSAPRILSRVLPDYPAAARLQGVSGLVLARIVIGTDGYAKTVTVSQSSGSQELDLAAVSALKKWTFSPAIQNGIATEVCFQVPVRFNLNGN